MRQKILFVITKGKWGGAQRYVYDLATSLNARQAHLPPNQFEVKVVVGQGAELPARLAAAGIKTIPLHSLGRDLKIWSDFKSFFSLIKIFRREKPDVIHLNSPKAAGLGALAGRLARMPRILYTVHGWTFKEDRFVFSRALIWLASWITMLLVDQAIVIAKSELVAGLKMPWCQEKIKLIRNGIAAPRFNPHRFLVEAPVIGTVAELHRNKGLRYLLLALDQIREEKWQATIVGEGEARKELQRLTAKLGLTDRVSFPGFIESEVILPTFDLFVLPSLKEGLPYVLMEAGAAGLPVIATTVGGIPEIVTTAESGLLVPPKDVAALAEALRSLLRSPGRRQKFGEKLKQKIEKEFSLERMVSEFVDLLDA